MSDVHPDRRVTIDIACGDNKVPGAYGIDVRPCEAADIVADVAEGLPLRTASATTVHAHHIFEHFSDFIPLMGEIHRVLKPHARLYVRVPHYSCQHAWLDPTHKRCFAMRTFDYFSSDHHYGYYFDFCFDVERRQLLKHVPDTMWIPLRWIYGIYVGIVNALTRLDPGLLENFAYLIGYDELVFDLRRA
jgi:SAM-dependent methyltransferase